MKLSVGDVHQPHQFRNTLTPRCSAMVTVHAAQAECLTQLADRSLASAAGASPESYVHNQLQHRFAQVQQQQLRRPLRKGLCRCMAVPHIHQAFNWDCGLACALMALQSLGATQKDLTTLRSLCCTTSVWTVDLAHLLCLCGLKVTLTTTVLGTNPAYASDAFYMENLAEDAGRVKHLFEAAEVAGISIQKRSVGMQQIVDCVSSGSHLVIALCDKRWLCSNMAYLVASDPEAVSPCLPPVCGFSSGFVGHYVVLCGHDAATDCFMVQDPASCRPYLRLPATTFDSARRAFGTDEDLLFISAEGRPLKWLMTPDCNPGV